MPLGHMGSGHNNASDFQTPGIPHIVTDTIPLTPYRIDFQNAARGITVRNTGSNPVRVAVTENGLGGTNYFLIPGGQSNSFSIRTKVLYLQAETGTTVVSVMAELSMVSERNFPLLTGSATVEHNPGSGWNGVG